MLDAADGVAAIELHRLHTGPVDLLITDLVMPNGVNGCELATHLRATRPDLKVIYVSGYTGEVLTRQLRLQQGRNFLPKPFSMHVLATMVRRRLDEPVENGQAAVLPGRERTA